MNTISLSCAIISGAILGLFGVMFYNDTHFEPLLWATIIIIPTPMLLHVFIFDKESPKTKEKVN